MHFENVKQYIGNAFSTPKLQEFKYTIGAEVPTTATPIAASKEPQAPLNFVGGVFHAPTSYVQDIVNGNRIDLDTFEQDIPRFSDFKIPSEHGETNLSQQQADERKAAVSDAIARFAGLSGIDPATTHSLVGQLHQGVMIEFQQMLKKHCKIYGVFANNVKEFKGIKPHDPRYSQIKDGLYSILKISDNSISLKSTTKFLATLAEEFGASENEADNDIDMDRFGNAKVDLQTTVITTISFADNKQATVSQTVNVSAVDEANKKIHFELSDMLKSFVAAPVVAPPEITVESSKVVQVIKDVFSASHVLPTIAGNLFARLYQTNTDPGAYLVTITEQAQTTTEQDQTTNQQHPEDNEWSVVNVARTITQQGQTTNQQLTEDNEWSVVDIAGTDHAEDDAPPAHVLPVSLFFSSPTPNVAATTDVGVDNEATALEQEEQTTSSFFSLLS